MKRIAPIVAAIALVAPASAAAQSSSTCQAYSSQTCGPVTPPTPPSSPTSSAPVQAKASAATLPFTGIDTALLAAGGATLLGAGVVIRVLSRRTG